MTVPAHETPSPPSSSTAGPSPPAHLAPMTYLTSDYPSRSPKKRPRSKGVTRTGARTRSALRRATESLREGMKLKGGSVGMWHPPRPAIHATQRESSAEDRNYVEGFKDSSPNGGVRVGNEGGDVTVLGESERGEAPRVKGMSEGAEIKGRVEIVKGEIFTSNAISWMGLHPPPNSTGPIIQSLDMVSPLHPESDQTDDMPATSIILRRSSRRPKPIPNSKVDGPAGFSSGLRRRTTGEAKRASSKQKAMRLAYIPPPFLSQHPYYPPTTASVPSGPWVSGHATQQEAQIRPAAAADPYAGTTSDPGGWVGRTTGSTKLPSTPSASPPRRQYKGWVYLDDDVDDQSQMKHSCGEDSIAHDDGEGMEEEGRKRQRRAAPRAGSLVEPGKRASTLTPVALAKVPV